MHTFLIIAAGLFGLLIGSFLNVVIWRVPREESLLPSSRCPSCHSEIRAHQNIPVLSYLFLQGKCGSCRAPISARYPLVELLTSLLFVLVTSWWLHVTPYGFDPATWLLLAAFLWLTAAAVALTMIDFDHLLLPSSIVLPTTAVIFALVTTASIVTGNPGMLTGALLGAAALGGFYFLIILVYPAGLGGGDLKLAPVLGFTLGIFGWGPVIIGGLSAFLLSAVIGLLLIGLRRVGRRTELPFGPYMFIGTALGVTVGTPILNSYLRFAGIA